jgi:hypothetical protein
VRTEYRKPYRVQVFATGLARGKNRKRYSELVTRDYGYGLWNPEQHYQEARLPGAGSFLFPGMFAARAAAMDVLSKAGTRQVCIRTNQDRPVYRFYKHADGTVTGYGYSEGA